MIFTNVLLRNGCSIIRSRPYTTLRIGMPMPLASRFEMVSTSKTFNHTTNFLVLGRRYSAEPKFNNQRIATMFRKMDDIPQNYELIYRVNFPSYLIAIQFMNLFAIITITFVMAGLLLKRDEPESKYPNELPPQIGAMESFRTDERLPTPSLDELLDLTWESMAIVLVAVIGLMLSLIKLQRTLPIRLYTSTFVILFRH